ncbi:MAG TPA: prepilin-type N-terminal cleavage/methylation domain-containing protein [Gemmatimonadaceae bacterium]|jgi:prepilin-type N-terminal cleavage/methylation domain-containing protein|nr:prepilin-type N-terminal cleavage/methylation domain-containing protein [Gemmatimonadaceae bacterium]
MNAHCFQSRRKRGFTLLEVMVVMIIAAVVTAMSVGRIHSLTVQQRLRRAAMASQNDIEAAFAIAIRNRQPVRIAWSSGTRQLVVTDRAGTTFFRRSNLGAVYGLAAAGVTFSRSPIEVYPNGLANDTLLITLTVETVTKRVRVSRSGLVRLDSLP